MAMLASAAVALGLILLAAIGGYVRWHRPQIQPEKLTVVPFTTFPGFEIAPSFSPDGNRDRLFLVWL